ncbi:Rieske (2Fe-2S) protein [Streptomyces sp. NPDC059009]|uniref:Rieske (2Fe-2S) protein n=1 Tax=Streptomyces sp. NPDC059009 TaxID=3346694 RepID=UPI00368D4667
MSAGRPSRRAVLGAAAVALAVTGCEKYGGEDGGERPETPPESPSGPQRTASPEELTKTSDIPVGGGKVFKPEKVVVTQPEAGEFKAFSAICTHNGCTVRDVSDGTINCPCHGSKYRVADASVADGPAPRPLPPRALKVTGKSISLA